MVVFGVEHIDEFVKRHHQAKKPLQTWLAIVKAEWFGSPIDLKMKIPHVDYVKPYTIFDIKGNHIRVIAIVVYRAGTMAIKHVLTHDEYMKGKWRRI